MVALQSRALRGIRRSKENPLRRYFRENDGLLIDKWMHYFDIYDRHLSAFRATRPTVIEFGVFHGGSLEMWREYFGRGATIIGVDIDPRCLTVAGEGIQVEIGDQCDTAFLADLADRHGPIDVVLDDGGHAMEHQLTTFEQVFPALASGGVYLVEDLHTSYWEEFGGGYRRPGTFIEKCKDVLDQMHAFHSRDDRLRPDNHTRSIAGMHCYDSVVVFEKEAVLPPERQLSGRLAFDDDRVDWPPHVLPPA